MKRNFMIALSLLMVATGAYMLQAKSKSSAQPATTSSASTASTSETGYSSMVCTSSGECPKHYICYDGFCATKKPSKCTQNSQCGSGICQNGSCTCSNDSDCVSKSCVYGLCAAAKSA